MRDFAEEEKEEALNSKSENAAAFKNLKVHLSDQLK